MTARPSAPLAAHAPRPQAWDHAPLAKGTLHVWRVDLAAAGDELLWLLSDAERAKLRDAKEKALKEPAVQAANQRRKQAEGEYRELLHKEILKTDPSLKPLLDTITELKKRAHEY